MMGTEDEERTEHQVNWWGTQPCRRCNCMALPARVISVICPDCDGSGWTVWAALATEPWTEIIPGLWIGGHDYNVSENGQTRRTDAYPMDTFDVVVSMFHRLGHEPTGDTDHYEALFPDGELGPQVLRQAALAASRVADALRMSKKVLVRCQAGLNRSSLVAGMALIDLGFSGEDAVQVIRARRSPWALCNEDYAAALTNTTQVTQALTLARSKG